MLNCLRKNRHFILSDKIRNIFSADMFVPHPMENSRISYKKNWYFRKKFISLPLNYNFLPLLNKLWQQFVGRKKRLRIS
ncbi:hypothetical protein BN938_1145 [Mucinivorans hirudinis]|uniref:Uncharacterized protein n=1 Tax=Mucinivorans hirudinis TaxID=1433126 RepID=A0A060R7K3_9BACT|nr:hypothetical protein BN938_1145 [Mucinivorans hirudinis]